MVKEINLSAATDEVLRPWTVNRASEQRLHDAELILDRTIAQTSPQKRAGLRGSSSLEYLPEYEDFKKTFRESRMGSTATLRSPEKLAPIRTGSTIVRQKTPELSPKVLQHILAPTAVEPSFAPNPNDPVELYRKRMLKKEKDKERARFKTIANSPSKKSPLSPVQYQGQSRLTPALFSITYEKLQGGR